MDHLAATTSGRVSSREGEEAEAEEEQEGASGNSPRREISFMPAAASASGSSSAASPSSAPSPAVEKEHMFDKVVTPSDVGKLNRLVIPKQYAEKYFPLGTAAGSEKGLLLAFEDAAGKHWRFRYSYWNSSQSYVMTKGWSRFVKEKRLLAGDTVSFSRAASASAAASADRRLFIDWKRRVDARVPLLRFPTALMPPHHHYAPPWSGGGGFFMAGGPGPSPPATLYEHHRLRQGFDFRAMSPMAMSMTYPAPPAVGRQLLLFGSAARTMMMPSPPRPPPLHYAMQPISAAAASTRPPPLVLDSVPAIESPTTAAKRVRLFGVNLDNNPPQSDSDGAGEASHQALSPAGWHQRTLRLLELPRHGGAAAESPSSSSSSKREAARSSALDLDL